MFSSDRLEEEFQPHYTAWKAKPGPQTASDLLTALDPVLTSAVRTYAGNASPTLRSKAKQITLQALPRYDPVKASLRGYLMNQLQGLRRHAAREAQIIHVPERAAIESYRLREAENQLRDKLGRDPSDAELRRHSGIPTRRFERLRKMPSTYAESSIRGVNEESDGDSVINPAVASTDRSAWVNFVYHGLEGPDQLIMEHSLGLNGKKKLSGRRIATKLGLSPSAVSQRGARIQQQLDLYEELGTSL